MDQVQYSTWQEIARVGGFENEEAGTKTSAWRRVSRYSGYVRRDVVSGLLDFLLPLSLADCRVRKY